MRVSVLVMASKKKEKRMPFFYRNGKLVNCEHVIVVGTLKLMLCVYYFLLSFYSMVPFHCALLLCSTLFLCFMSMC